MSERLDELRRQRALAQEQIAWLDREISRESGQVAAPPPSPARAPGPVMSADAARAADEILARYRDESPNTERDVKRGCYGYFAFGLGLLVIFAVAAYFIYTHRQ